MAVPAVAQPTTRKIGELELSVRGVSAVVDPASLVVPKNVASGARVRVQAGEVDLDAADVARFMGSGFEVQGELSGPGLGGVVTLPRQDPGAVTSADPLILALPPLPVAG